MFPGIAPKYFTLGFRMMPATDFGIGTVGSKLLMTACVFSKLTLSREKKPNTYRVYTSARTLATGPAP